MSASQAISTSTTSTTTTTSISTSIRGTHSNIGLKKPLLGQKLMNTSVKSLPAPPSQQPQQQQQLITPPQPPVQQIQNQVQTSVNNQNMDQQQQQQPQNTNNTIPVSSIKRLSPTKSIKLTKINNNIKPVQQNVNTTTVNLPPPVNNNNTTNAQPPQTSTQMVIPFPNTVPVGLGLTPPTPPPPLIEDLIKVNDPIIQPPQNSDQIEIITNKSVQDDLQSMILDSNTTTNNGNDATKSENNNINNQQQNVNPPLKNPTNNDQSNNVNNNNQQPQQQQDIYMELIKQIQNDLENSKKENIALRNEIDMVKKQTTTNNPNTVVQQQPAPLSYKSNLMNSLKDQPATTNRPTTNNQLIAGQSKPQKQQEKDNRSVGSKDKRQLPDNQTKKQKTSHNRNINGSGGVVVNNVFPTFDDELEPIDSQSDDGNIYNNNNNQNNNNSRNHHAHLHQAAHATSLPNSVNLAPPLPQPNSPSITTTLITTTTTTSPPQQQQQPVKEKSEAEHYKHLAEKYRIRNESIKKAAKGEFDKKVENDEDQFKNDLLLLVSRTIKEELSKQQPQQPQQQNNVNNQQQIQQQNQQIRQQQIQLTEQQDLISSLLKEAEQHKLQTDLYQTTAKELYEAKNRLGQLQHSLTSTERLLKEKNDEYEMFKVTIKKFIEEERVNHEEELEKVNKNNARLEKVIHDLQKKHREEVDLWKYGVNKLILQQQQQQQLNNNENNNNSNLMEDNQQQLNINQDNNNQNNNVNNNNNDQMEQQQQEEELINNQDNNDNESAPEKSVHESISFSIFNSSQELFISHQPQYDSMINNNNNNTTDDDDDIEDLNFTMNDDIIPSNVTTSQFVRNIDSK